MGLWVFFPPTNWCRISSTHSMVPEGVASPDPPERPGRFVAREKGNIDDLAEAQRITFHQAMGQCQNPLAFRFWRTFIPTGWLFFYFWIIEIRGKNRTSPERWEMSRSSFFILLLQSQISIPWESRHIAWMTIAFHGKHPATSDNGTCLVGYWYPISISNKTISPLLSLWKIYGMYTHETSPAPDHCRWNPHFWCIQISGVDQRSNHTRPQGSKTTGFPKTSLSICVGKKGWLTLIPIDIPYLYPITSSHIPIQLWPLRVWNGVITPARKVIMYIYSYVSFEWGFLKDMVVS